MDFSRELLSSDGVASRSKIHYIHGVPENPVTLDDKVNKAANQAALDLFQTTNPLLAESLKYPDQTLPPKPTIQEGDLVVIFESFDQLTFVYVDPEKTFSNRNGVFPHSDFIGLPFGSQVRSRDFGGYGFVFLLKPTPELWARSLPHRTQIIHELDAATIVHYLELRPNMTVIESGTGSGAMSHAICRVIAPHGQLYTYEFNEMRSRKARTEFAKNGVDRLVQVIHRDVCGRGASKAGGFMRPKASVDAVLLDLPEPWLAVPHAAFCLKPGARLASYSPCVEQVQKTCEQLRKSGFHSVETIEVRLREYHVDDIELLDPPTERRKRVLGNPIHDQVRSQEVVKKEKEIRMEESSSETVIQERKRRRMVVTRPFPAMRGHTAFLTFCTAGNSPAPDPKDSTDDSHDGDKEDSKDK